MYCSFIKNLFLTICIVIPFAANAAIEEIIVTAEKKEEDLQDVGISVTGLSSDALEAGGVQDVTRIELLVPGVNFGYAGNDAKFNVRGSNSNDTYGGATSTVGMFVDGIYKPRAAQQSRQFFDVARIEFLRGPQGTLYGRNTLAGALNLYSNEPTPDGFEASLDSSFARFNKVRNEAAVNIPISDKTALRVAALKQTSDGFIENSVGPNLGADDKGAIRLSVSSQLSNGIDILARVGHVDEGGTSPGTFGYTGLCRPTNASGLTDPAGTSFDCVNVQRGSGGAAGSLRWDQLGPYHVQHDFVNENTLDETTLSLHLDGDLGDISVTSITSYSDFQSLTGIDGDFGPNPYSRYWYEDNAESFSQEVQFSAGAGSSIEWTAGAYFSQDKTFYSFSTVRTTVDVANPAAVEVTLSDGTSASESLRQSTTLASMDTNLNRHYADFQEVESDYLGIFFQSDFKMSDELSVIAGVRYNDEDINTAGGSNFSDPAPVVSSLGYAAGDSPATIPVSPQQAYTYNFGMTHPDNNSDSFDNVTWKLGVEFDLQEDIMLYATASTGFLSGIVNRSSVTDEQESEVVEFGLKSVLFENTLQLNISVHSTTYSNLVAQLQTVDPNSGDIITTSRNGGEVESRGVEVEWAFAPDDALRVSGNFALLDSEYGEYGFSNPYSAYSGQLPVIGGTSVSVSGQDMILGGVIQFEGEPTPWSPDFTFNMSASYRFDLANGGNITPALQVSYSDDYNASGRLPNDPAGHQDAYTKSDVRVRWTSASAKYSVQAFIENISDEAVNARANVGGGSFPQTSFLYPRNYGLTVSARL